MVVILIIGILAGLLLNGVMAARAAALNAGVVAEMKNLEKAIADFKLKFGEEPPSSIILYENDTGWALTGTPTVLSRAFIRQIWPQFNFGLDRDINGDGDQVDVIALNGAECLVFFLGGVNSTNVVTATGTLQSGATANDGVTAWVPHAYSEKPAKPLAR